MVAMISKDDQFLGKLAAALRSVGIEAIIVGNTASILNDAPVLTQDVDLLVRDTPLNRRKLKKLAAELGGTGPAPITKLTTIEHIFGTRVPIDILFDKMIGTKDFASVRSHARQVAVGTDVLTVASLEDVIKSKKAAGRAKDLAVMPILETTLAARRARGLP
jgi:nucleotidyltransferase DUF2204